MPAPIEFFFDFSSPYAYFASEDIEPLAQRSGRSVWWRPILLGAVFKVTGGAPLTQLHAAKDGYSRRDFERSAAFAGVPYRHPDPFPIGAVAASRAVLWLQREQPDMATAFIHAVFRDFFAGGVDVSRPEAVTAVASGLGIDAAALTAGTQDELIKSALKLQNDEAIARGVFGVPTVFVDGEMFWGHDRLPHVERWITRGPF